MKTRAIIDEHGALSLLCHRKYGNISKIYIFQTPEHLAVSHGRYVMYMIYTLCGLYVASFI